MGRKSFEQFGIEERCEIARRRQAGESIRQIAAALDRAPSSISRELKRNTGATGYQSVYAGEQARARRWQGSRLLRCAELQEQVLEGLRRGWSPEQVSRRLAQQGLQISYESIYRFIAAQIARTNDFSWRLYLPRAKSKRGFRGRKGGSPAEHIQRRVSIEKRPKAAADRRQAGHWEADLMLFARYGQAILTLHERTSRLTAIVRQPSKAAAPVAQPSRPCWLRCPQPCVAASPLITVPNSPCTTPCINPWACGPTSAIRIPLGKRAASRTPTGACAAGYPAAPMSQTSPQINSYRSLRSTITHHESASALKPPPRSSPKCCISNVNPPTGLRRYDVVL